MTPEILNQYESEIGTFAPMTEGQRFREVIAYVRELEKDKARLDWLNDNCHCVGFATLYGDRVCEVYSVDDQRRKDFKAKNVRQAIDNAKGGE